MLRSVIGQKVPQEEPAPTELIAGCPYYVGPVSNGVTRNWKRGRSFVIGRRVYSLDTLLSCVVIMFAALVCFTVVC